MSRGIDEELFELLDTRGIGSLTLDQINELTEHARRNVSVADTSQIFSLFQDKRGTIDRTTFSRLLRGIESASRLTGSELLERHLDAQYRLLFDLVDEDEGGTLSRAEVRPLLDTIIQVFGIKTISDVGIVFRSVGVGINDDILFPQFRTIVQRIVGSHPISHVISAFRDMKAKKKSAFDRGARLRALTSVHHSTIGGTTAEPSVIGSSFEAGGGGASEHRVSQLESRVRELEEQLSRASAKDDPLSCDTALPPRLPKPMRVSQSTLVAFEIDGDASAADVGTLGRLAVQAACTDALFRTVLDSSCWSRSPAAITEMIESSQSAVNDMAAAIPSTLTQLDIGLRQAIASDAADDLSPPASYDDGTGMHVGEDAADCRLSHDEDVLCMVQSALHEFSAISSLIQEVHEHREALAMAAAATAHVATQRRKISTAVISFQGASCAFISASLAFRTLLGDLETALLAVVRNPHAAASNGPSAPCELSREERFMFLSRCSELQYNFSAVLKGLTKTLAELEASLSTHYTRTKDRACQANIAPPQAMVAHQNGSAEDVRSPSPRGAPSMMSASRPPRSRARRGMERRGPERVDALVAQHLIQRGVPVPPNFRRVEEGRTSNNGGRSLSEGGTVATVSKTAPSNPLSTKSFFWFGTKKVELSALDDHTLCVHVGGGFLLFEEYCKAHTEFETVRWHRHGVQKTGFHDAGGHSRGGSEPNYARGSSSPPARLLF